MAQIDHCAIHHVGNAQREEALLLSGETLSLSEDIKSVLGQYFLGAFKENSYRPTQYLRFTHETDLAMNEVQTLNSLILR